MLSRRFLLWGPAGKAARDTRSHLRDASVRTFRDDDLQQEEPARQIDTPGRLSALFRDAQHDRRFSGELFGAASRQRHFDRYRVDASWAQRDGAGALTTIAAAAFAGRTRQVPRQREFDGLTAQEPGALDADLMLHIGSTGHFVNPRSDTTKNLRQVPLA
jgi:hypothetical protein